MNRERALDVKMEDLKPHGIVPIIKTVEGPSEFDLRMTGRVYKTGQTVFLDREGDVASKQMMMKGVDARYDMARYGIMKI